MTRRHIIISGTGRAGTTFLVQLLTELGLDTGFSDSSSGIFENCNAGMERDLRDPDAPYIVKSPFLCDYLGELLENASITVEHAIIPIRDLYSAAESRRDVSRRSGHDPAANGGLWHTDKPERQEDVLTHQFYKLLHTIAKHDIPMTLLSFPRLAQEPDYLYQKLTFLVGGIAHDAFYSAFRAIARPELIHTFQTNR
jgi:hypothetical protein